MNNQKKKKTINRMQIKKKNDRINTKGIFDKNLSKF